MKNSLARRSPLKIQHSKLKPQASAARSLRTVGALVRYGARRFRRARLVFGHGTDNATDEAAWLALHVLDLAPEITPRILSRAVSPRTAERILRIFERRIGERKPAAYLTRKAWLGNLRFYVDQRVIVPRSHIAGLLQQGLAPWLREPGKVRAVLDLCTGSGCLAILAAQAFPDAKIDAADISAAALAVARRNVRDHRLTRRIRLFESDLYSNLKGRRYDLIICNPPYVTAGGMRRLPPEHRREPTLALAGGSDGLDAVRRIVTESGRHLRPGGLLVVEVGRGRRRVERAFGKIPFVWPETDPAGAVFVVEREEIDRAIGC